MAGSGFTANDVAAWMLEQVQAKPLYQEDVAWEVKRHFGDDFTYDNELGNPAIDKDVLKKFRALSGDDVVWSRSERLWRKRTARDAPGRMQE